MISANALILAEQLIKRHEGLRLVAYQDTMGVWTVGYGHAHVAPDLIITAEQAEDFFQDDFTTTQTDYAAMFPDLNANDNQCAALLDMLFNLGRAKLATFTTFLHFVEMGHWADAAHDLELTLWYRQVGVRAKDDVELLGTA